MQIRYYETAWNDISNSPGWIKKVCLLALINLIPIFGQIVTLGYLFGWARDISWGVHAPLPERIFGNEDGKLYRRGWFVLLITFVFALVPGIIISVGSGITMIGASVHVAADGSVTMTGGSTIAGLLGTVVMIAGTVFAFVVEMLSLVGGLRASIYDRLSAGFQISKLWSMARRDTMGLVKIFCMIILVGLVVGIVLSIILGIVFTVWGVTIGLSAGGTVLSAVNANMSDAQIAQIVLSSGLAGSMLLSLMVLLLVATYISLMASVFVEMLEIRAIGYWMSQFDVPHWGGQDDPLPFENAPAGQATTPYAASSAGVAAGVGAGMAYGAQYDSRYGMPYGAQYGVQQAPQQAPQQAQQPYYAPQTANVQPPVSGNVSQQYAAGQPVQYPAQGYAQQQPYASDAYAQQPVQGFGQQQYAVQQQQPYAVQQPVQGYAQQAYESQQQYATQQQYAAQQAYTQQIYNAEQYFDAALPPQAEAPATPMGATQSQPIDMGQAVASSSVFEQAQADVNDAFASASQEFPGTAEFDDSKDEAGEGSVR